MSAELLYHFNLSGRHCVVTGASSGIGYATVILFCAAGADSILMVARRGDVLENAKETIIGNGWAGRTRLETVSADVGTIEGRAAVSARIPKEGLDVLVNNAGAFEGKGIAELDEATWHEFTNANLVAPAELTRTLLPLLKDGAAVVNISSSLAVGAIPKAHAYSAAKAGLVQFTKSLALELAPRRIRVNAVLPGVVDTPMVRARSGSDEEHRVSMQFFQSIHPLGTGMPDQIAPAILFLVSNGSSWITGAALPVDGGVLAA